MKNKIVTCLGAALLAAACTPKPTEAELNRMCNNYVKLKEEISPSTEKDLVAAAEALFDRKESQLKELKATHLKEWDDTLARRLMTATKEKEIAALKAESAKKKEETVAKYDPEIAALVGKRKAAVDEAGKKGKENEAAWKKAVAECVDKAVAEGVSQQLAQCRIKVDNIGYYVNRCK